MKQVHHIAPQNHSAPIMISDYKPVFKNTMDLKALRQLVKNGETAKVEFKLKTNHPDKIMKEVVAFANTDGGLLLLGVSDDRQVKGLPFADEDCFIIQKAIEKYIYPKIDYEIERIRIEGEYEVLIFHIPTSPFKPHYVDTDGIEENRKAYVRIHDKSVQASREMREVLKGQRKGKDLRFSFGSKEQLLMKYLESNKHITSRQFAELADIPKKSASRTLILLVLTNVLQILPNENMEDFFAVKAVRV